MTDTTIQLDEQIAAVAAYIERCEQTGRMLRTARVPASVRFEREVKSMRAVLATLESIDHAR